MDFYIQDPRSLLTKIVNFIIHRIHTKINVQDLTMIRK